MVMQADTVRRAVTVPGRRLQWWRRHREPGALVVLLVAVLATGAAILTWPELFPIVTLAPWVVLAALFLSSRSMIVLYAVVAVIMALTVPTLVYNRSFTVLAIVGLGSLMVMMWVLAASRARLGIVGFTGEDLLVDLRDRLARAARLPDLPRGWRADSAVRSAHGDAFSGDFLVGALSNDDRRLEVVLVDVSGKGREAGSRSLHLSGALSGLLGSVPPEEFLPAANAYLLRQRWPEGFATAIHLDIDLVSGAFSVGSAGHPASARFHGDSQRWQLSEQPTGPLLGVFGQPRFGRSYGRLDVGDALVLFSDGVVEAPDLTMDEGVDRVLQSAEAALGHEDVDVAAAVCDASAAGNGDDRTAFVLQRTP